MIIYSLSLENDAQLETSHEGSGYDPEPEPESKEPGNDYLDDLYGSESDEDEDEKDDSKGKIVVVTEKIQNGKDYMDDYFSYGMHDSDPPSFYEPFAAKKEGDNNGNDYQDFMLWKH